MLIHFKYLALNNRGDLVEDIVLGSSKEKVRLELFEKDLVPIEIKLYSIFVQKISYDELYFYFKKLSYFIETGVDIVRAIEILSKESKNKVLGRAGRSISENISKGKSVSESFDESKVFPIIAISMIKVGEETGNLDEAFKKLSKYFKGKDKLRKKIKRAITYPTILLVVSLFMFIFILFFIVPRFKEIFIDNSIDLPLISKIVIDTSDIFRSRQYILLLIPLIFYGGYRFVENSTKKIALEKLKLNLPIYKRYYKKKVELEILTPMSMMYPSGIDIDQIFKVIQGNIKGAYLKKQVDDIRESIMKGGSISQSFKSTKLFNETITTSIQVGEVTGMLDNILLELTEFHQEELIDDLDKMVIFIEPSLIIIVGIFIGGLAVGMILPMLNLIDGIL